MQKNSVLETKRNFFNFLELELLADEELVLSKVLNNGNAISFNDICIFKRLQNKLLVSNSINLFEPVGFKKEILDLEKIIVKRCFITNSVFQPKTYLEYLKVRKQLHFKLTIKEEFKLAIKSLVCFQSL